MLKQFSLAVIITALFSGSAIADGGRDSKTASREVILTEGFARIIIEGEADLLLIEGESMSATIEDEAIDLNSTRITTQNGVLKIQVTRNRNKRPLIKLHVNRLQVLEVNGDSNIRTLSTLKSENLRVLINSACKIALRVMGNVAVTASEGIDYEFLKKEKIRIVREIE